MRESLIYGAATHTGLVRANNEDHYAIIDHDGGFPVALILADGMGGHRAGDVASRLGLDSILEYLENNTLGDGCFSEKTFQFAVDYSNHCIQLYKKKDPQIQKMGTTFIALALSESGATTFNIGDSRIYRLRAPPHLGWPTCCTHRHFGNGRSYRRF